MIFATKVLFRLSLGVPEARPRQPRPSVGTKRRLAPQGAGGRKHGGRGEFGMFVEMYFDMTYR